MSEHAFIVSTTSMHTWSQMVPPALMMFWSKSKQVCIKCFCRSSMSWIFVSCTLCCIIPHKVNFRQMMTLVHFDEAMLHLMQLSLIISHCNITFSVFWRSQGSLATLIRWGGWNSYCHVSFISKSNSEKCIKICWFLTKLPTKISLLFFMAHGVEPAKLHPGLLLRTHRPHISQVPTIAVEVI